jgi:hypothetical protein
VQKCSDIIRALNRVLNSAYADNVPVYMGCILNSKLGLCFSCNDIHVLITVPSKWYTSLYFILKYNLQALKQYFVVEEFRYDFETSG